MGLPSDGMLRDAGPIKVCTAPNAQEMPVLTAIGSDFFVAWQDRRDTATSGVDIYGTVVNRDGMVIDTNGIPICRVAGDQTLPAVASNGTNCFVVWQDTRNAGTNHPDIYGMQVSSAGVPADPNGQAISTTVNLEDTPAIASNGTNSLVVWVDGRSYPP